MELNQNSIESDLLRIKREQETTIKNQLDHMKAQLSTCEDSLRTLKIELEQRVTMQLLKESNRRLEEGIQSSLAQKIRDSMKKYEPIIEGFEDFKRFKHSFLEHEDRYLEFQTRTQTKLVRLADQTLLENDLLELKNAPPPVVEQKIELPHIPQIDENEFEDMKFNVRQLKSSPA